MDKFTTRVENDGTSKLYENGNQIAYFGHDCLSASLLDKICIALNLLASLTPDEGLVASKEITLTSECVFRDWYYADLTNCGVSYWWKYYGNHEYYRLSEGEVFFVSSVGGVHPAVKLDCKVGDIKLFEKCKIGGLALTRLKDRDDGACQLYDAHGVLYCYDDTEKCLRVVEEGEKAMDKDKEDEEHYANRH